MIKKMPIDVEQGMGHINDSNDTLKEVIDDLLPLFRQANKFLLGALFIVFSSDIILLMAGYIKAQDRIVDRYIVLSFIAATAAEISIIIVTSIKKLK